MKPTLLASQCYQWWLDQRQQHPFCLTCFYTKNTYSLFFCYCGTLELLGRELATTSTFTNSTNEGINQNFQDVWEKAFSGAWGKESMRLWLYLDSKPMKKQVKQVQLVGHLFVCVLCSSPYDISIPITYAKSLLQVSSIIWRMSEGVTLTAFVFTTVSMLPLSLGQVENSPKFSKSFYTWALNLIALKRSPIPTTDSTAPNVAVYL